MTTQTVLLAVAVAIIFAAGLFLAVWMYFVVVQFLR